MTGKSATQTLKGVSRSFYLSLRLLPGPMRPAATIAYLLARTSDTLADAAAAAVEVRLDHLTRFRDALLGNSADPRWPVALLNSIGDVMERRLLESSGEILASLRSLSEPQQVLIREVLETIIGGQTLDLERFGYADREHPVALPDAAALEDYAWRVAGCVGAFWTKLGYLTMGDRYSRTSVDELLELGVCYGKGLQLVNILRDLPADLADGRCYLPVTDPTNISQLMECHARWLPLAEGWISQGESYAATLVSRRLRGATILPAWIARKTLESLREADWETLRRRVKVPRSEVYKSLARAFFHPPPRP